MAAKETGCCESGLTLSPSGFQVESLITIDERGQMVLPKDVRAKAGITAGDKLALVSCEQNGKFCCLTLLKADDLVGMVKNHLGPLVNELTQ